MTTPGYVEFEFDLPGALLTALFEVFEKVVPALLTDAGAVGVPADAQGVYQLQYTGRLVYVGKTDAEAGLSSRLQRHSWMIRNRKNLNAALVTYKAVRVFVFTAVDLETQLIKQYRKQGRAPEWNGSGFGANDPGRNRDHTEVESDNFDALFPIDIDHPLALTFGDKTAAGILSALRQALPYVFRFQPLQKKSRKPHLDLARTLPLPAPPHSARSVLNHVVAHLPPGWQATELPGRLLLYKEKADYAHGNIVARS